MAIVGTYRHLFDGSVIALMIEKMGVGGAEEGFTQIYSLLPLAARPTCPG